MTPILPDAAEIAGRLNRASRSGVSTTSLAELTGDIDRLFEAHQDRVYAYCLRFVRRPERALELAQDTLLLAYQKLPTFRGDARFDTWLYKIARFICLNAVRKHSEVLADDGIIEVADPEQSVLSRLRRQEREELFRISATSALDPQEQEAVFLRYVEYLPLDTITELLAIEAPSGARGVLQRCKRKLRREIRARLEEMGHGSSFVRGSIE